MNFSVISIYYKQKHKQGVTIINALITINPVRQQFRTIDVQTVLPVNSARF